MDQMLVKAARVGDVTTLLNLLEADPEILERASSAHFIDSALHIAALYGKSEFVKQILSRKPSLATETNQQGMIPLHLATLEGHVETVKELLKAELDEGVNQCLLKEDEGWNPLHCASQKGKISVIKELINSCPQSLEQVTEKGETVLHVAVKANQFEAVNVLEDRIKHHNLNLVLRAQDLKGKTAYELAAAKRKQLQVPEVRDEEDEEGEEIREERHIKMEVERRHGEVSKGERRNNNEGQSQEDAILVMATLLITLSYGALSNPPSTFFKDGSTEKELGVLAILFIIFNSLIFFTSIYAVMRTVNVFFVRGLTFYLVLCYSFMLTATNFIFLYMAIPFALGTYLIVTLSVLPYVIALWRRRGMTRCPHQQLA